MGKGKYWEHFGFGTAYVTETVTVTVETEIVTPADRMRSACGGVCIGVVLFLGALGVLGWNEKRAVYTAQTIDYARSEFVQLDGCEPADASTGKLIAFQGCDPATSYSPSNYDLLQGVAASGGANGDVFAPADVVFSWARHTQQYVNKEVVHKATSQRTHTQKTSSPSTTKKTTTTKITSTKTATWYTYEKQWVNSAQKYSNPLITSPPSWPAGWGAASGVAPLVCIGGNAHGNASCTTANGDSWLLHSSVSWDRSKIRNMGNSEDVPILPYASVTTTLYTTYAIRYHTWAKAKYCGKYLQTHLDTHFHNTCTPQAAIAGRQGDFRFTFTRKTGGKNYVVSALAQQTKKGEQYGLEEWQNPHHSGCSYCTIGTITEGSKSGDDILNELASANKAITWVLRFVGWLVCWFGLQLVAGPVALAPDFIPVVGDMIGGILGPILCCLTCTLATSFALLAIAIAWLAYRPLIGVPLLLVFCLGCAGTVVLVLRFQKKRRNGTSYNEAGAINGTDSSDEYDLQPHDTHDAHPPQPLTRADHRV